MLIQINDDYRITSDSMNIIVEERKVTKEAGKLRAAGEEYWSAVGYFPNVQMACKWLVDHQVRMSGATDLRDVIESIRKANDELISAIRRYVDAVSVRA